MDNQPRPLDEYFDAARHEPGISETEVRAIVREAATKRRPRALWLWAGASVGIAGLIVGATMMGDAPDTGAVRDGAGTVASQTQSVGESIGATRGATKDSDSAASNDINTNTPISEDTMNRKDVVRGAAAAVMAVGMTTAVSAQEASTTKQERRRVTIEMSHDLSPTTSKLADELGRTAANYWVARLNAYKTRIDRMLSPDDLASLNRMRVKFGVMLAENAEVSAHARIIDREDEEIIIDRELGGKDGAERRVDGDRKERREVRIQVKGDSKDGLEIFTLHQSAKEIADRYRVGFDALGKDVIADFVVFLKEMRAAGQTFMAAHKAEMEREVDGEKASVTLNAADDVIESFDSDEKRMMMQMVYAIAAEPIIMLYDGGDLKQIFGQGPLSSAVTGMNIPETNALKQNVPNPAGTSTTIAYTLGAPSSATLLRLYNASGELVGTYDQGARDAGDHAATIDLSKLPNGVYLYHLTAQTPDGERVYSKPMQIAR